MCIISDMEIEISSFYYRIWFYTSCFFPRTFNFDDFKRVYSNEDEKKSIPYFWEKFDPENYSIWFGEYKYPEELTKVFMSCNLITGMYQRLDKMRKQAFASVCLFGTDNDSSISGVWVWRGQELAFPVRKQFLYENFQCICFFDVINLFTKLVLF